jgi:hypothetical protein
MTMNTGEPAPVEEAAPPAAVESTVESTPKE